MCVSVVSIDCHGKKYVVNEYTHIPNILNGTIFYGKKEENVQEIVLIVIIVVIIFVLVLRTRKEDGNRTKIKDYIFISLPLY